MAERFELYVAGIELANGYNELLDAAELRARNARVNRQRLADGKPALPAESRLLLAMEAGLPPMVGVALGFDRLVMLAAGQKNIAEVIAFPFDRAYAHFSPNCRVGQANRGPGGASVAATWLAGPKIAGPRLIGLRSPTRGLRDLDPPYGLSRKRGWATVA